MRIRAREKMMELLVEAHAKGQIPQYGLKHKVYLSEVLVDPMWIASDHTQRQTVIDWPQVPNEAMVPQNDVAKAIYEQFQLSIGSSAKVVAERPLVLTAGGVVVHGRPQPQRRGQQAAHANQPGPENEGLNIHHRGRPGAYKETHVLGTVAPAARQTA
jgi:hypothetical protein